MRVVLTGATGTLGRRLVQALDADITVLSRDVRAARHAVAASRFVAIGIGGIPMGFETSPAEPR